MKRFVILLLFLPGVLHAQGTISGTGSIKGAGVLNVAVAASGGFSGGWTDLGAATVWGPLCPNAGGARPDVQGSSGCGYVADAWSGGAPDMVNNRLLFAGGGHKDYYGNEVYSLNLFGPTTSTTTRLDIASDVTGINPDANTYDACPDGTMCPRHTYGGVGYDPVNSWMVFVGGGLVSNGVIGNTAWKVNISCLNPASTAGSCSTPLGATMSGGSFSSNFGNQVAYDINTDSIWAWEALPFPGAGSGNGHLWQYNRATNTMTLKATYDGSSTFMDSYQQVTVDPQRQRLWAVGNGHIYWVSIASGSTFAVTDLAGTASGCGSFDGTAYPGLAFDYSDKKLVVWNTGNTVQVFNPDTNSCAAETYSGGPPNPDGGYNGNFGRFQYFPLLGIFAEVNNLNNHAFALRRNVDFPMVNSFANTLAGVNVPGGAASIVSSQSFETTVPSCGPPFPCDSYAQGRMDYLHKTEADSPVPDCTQAASGNCSEHFVINAGSFQGNSGSYYHTFNSTQTALYGQNSEFYVQYKERLGPEFMQPGEFSGPFTSFKMDIIGEGDSPTQKANDCADTPTDMVGASSLDQTFPSVYVNCGGTAGPTYFLSSDFMFIQLTASNLPGGSNFLDQDASGCAHYHDGSHTTPRTDPTCWNFVANEWFTVQSHVKVGTWATANSTIERWYAHQNQSSRLSINAADAALNDLGGSFTDKFGRLVLLPYATGVNWVNATNAWYDDVIISNRRLPDPNSNVPNGPDNLTLSAISSAHITVNWRVNSFNVTPQDDIGFIVERCTGDMPTCYSNPQSGFSQIGSVTAPHVSTFTDSTVSAGHTYTYRVRAKGLFGNSAYAESICFNGGTTCGGTAGI